MNSHFLVVFRRRFLNKAFRFVSVNIYTFISITYMHTLLMCVLCEGVCVCECEGVCVCVGVCVVCVFAIKYGSPHQDHICAGINTC